MENAAIDLCRHTLAFGRDRSSTGVLILAGPGGNGGDGLALARHLHNAEAGVHIALLGQPSPETDASVNLGICRRMGLGITALDPESDSASPLDSISPQIWEALGGAPVIIDALLGVGLDREVQGITRNLIEHVNSMRRPVVAVDLPSGMDPDTGRALGACIRADLTCTFGGIKRGFGAPEARESTGRVVLCPIGAPRELLDQLADRR